MVTPIWSGDRANERLRLQGLAPRHQCAGSVTLAGLQSMAECSSFPGRELDQQSNGLLSREVRVRVPGGPPFPDRITAVQPPLKRHFWPCASTWCDSSSGSQFVGVNSKRRESTLSRWKKWVRVPSRPPFVSGRSVAANAPAWGAGESRRKSGLPTNNSRFPRFAPVAQSTERRRPKAEAAGENPAASTIPGT